METTEKKYDSTIERSAEINELAKSMALAQSEVENPVASSDNPFYSSKYADLASVLNMTRKIFSKHGISIIQHPGYRDNMVQVTTVICHSSGQWMSSTICAPAFKADKFGVQKPVDTQSIGSAITYCRRYALAAVTGVAQDDDDGNKASGKTKENPDNQYENKQNNRQQVVTKKATTWNKLSDVAHSEQKKPVVESVVVKDDDPLPDWEKTHNPTNLFSVPQVILDNCGKLSDIHHKAIESISSSVFSDSIITLKDLSLKATNERSRVIIDSLINDIHLILKSRQ